MQKKKIILYILIIFFFILLIIFSSLSIKTLENNLSTCCKSFCDFDSTSPFSINKIVYFSSSNCESSINQNSSFTISNLYQYTDIAIFINNNSNGNYTAQNTLKRVSLSDIKFYMEPSIGTPALYYKNINDFAKSNFDESKKIENNIDFICTSEDSIDFSEPVLYNNTANPITLCYVNSNLINNYTLEDTISNISYNGSLLKMCNITLNSISCKLSFLVTIENNQDEIYTCPVILTIPLSTEKSTIYDGSLVLTDSTNYNFIKSKKN